MNCQSLIRFPMQMRKTSFGRIDASHSQKSPLPGSGRRILMMAADICTVVKLDA